MELNKDSAQDTTAATTTTNSLSGSCTVTAVASNLNRKDLQGWVATQNALPYATPRASKAAIAVTFGSLEAQHSLLEYFVLELRVRRDSTPQVKPLVNP